MLFRVPFGARSLLDSTNTRAAPNLLLDREIQMFTPWLPRGSKQQSLLTRKIKIDAVNGRSQIPNQGFGAADDSRALGSDLSAMANKFTGGGGNVIIEEGSKGLNPGMVVLLVVLALVLLFFGGNYALYVYAQRTLPPKKKKPISKKKMKKERLKQGVSAPGE